MWYERDCTVTKSMRTIINKQVSLVHIRKPHIDQAKRTSLDSLDSNTILDLKEIRKHITKLENQPVPLVKDVELQLLDHCCVVEPGQSQHASSQDDHQS